MPLSDALHTLKNRAFSELNEAMDYFTDTTVAWGMVRNAIDLGQPLETLDTATGAATTPAELEMRARRYLAEQLPEATFQQFVSIFESFWFDFLGLWLSAYPQSLGKRTVDVETMLALPDKDAIIQSAVLRELNEVLYQRPADWFKYLEDRAKLGCPSSEEVARVAEIKATRDILIHNRGVVNRIYIAKAGGQARFKDGERLRISEKYHRSAWELLRKIVVDVSDAAIEKTR